MFEKLLKDPVTTLRYVGIMEGISFLVLLGIAMPLKYMFALPIAVKLVGWLHGLLFMLFIYALINVRVYANWSLKWVFYGFIASILPFGTFVLDHQLKRQENDNLLSKEGV